MITVESKLDLFNKVVLEKIKKEQRRVLDEIEEKREQALANQEKESSKKADVFLRTIIEEAYDDRKSLLARAKIDKKQKVLNQRQALINQLADAVLKRFDRFTEEDNYSTYIHRMVEGHSKDLKEFGQFSVVLDRRHFDRDKALFEKSLKAFDLQAGAYLQSDESIVGGCIFYSEHKDVLIDVTLVSVIEDHRKEIGQRMYVMLNEVGGQHGDE